MPADCRRTDGSGLGHVLIARLDAATGGRDSVVALLVAREGSPYWPRLFFASLDQLLPVITLDKAHDALIFGGASVQEKPYPVRIYFYVHKFIGWVLGSLIIAGLAGLTQRN